MDVNRAQAVAALNSYSGGRKDGNKDRRDEHRAPHEDADVAVEVDGLAAQITPDVQKLLDDLAGEIEPLRAKLALMEKRNAAFESALSRHTYLPVLSRREFNRELTHVLTHLGDLSDLPHLALIYVANAEDIRRRYGRQAFESYLAHIAAELDRVKLPTDVLGGVGGADIALAMLDESTTPADKRLRGMVETIAKAAFKLGSETIVPDLRTGLVELRAGASADAILRDADADLRRHL